MKKQNNESEHEPTPNQTDTPEDASVLADISLTADSDVGPVPGVPEGKSPKALSLERKIMRALPEVLHELAHAALEDEEILAYQDYANVVSIRRLGYNDHGPVHMRKVVLNALKMADLLEKADVPLSLEREGGGTHDDSVAAIFLGGLLHDIGMSVTRDGHEHVGARLALPILDRLLPIYTGNDIRRMVTIRSLAVETIVGHMATVSIHSIEAGLILIADGCDMEKGRARIPMLLNTHARVGDIHKYSSAAVEKIRITEGERKPICITIEMSSTVGFFQVEEVLFTKLNSSPVKPFIELQAGVDGEEMKVYL